MMNSSLSSLSALALAAGLFGAASCFTGDGALGLPCNDKGDCGQEQACMAGLCATIDAGPCGDGRLNRGEACDDGNTEDGDACTALCTIAACGDGIIQVGVEACDDGADNSDAGACSVTCTINSCGDGLINGGDECDDGAQNGPAKACTPECTDNVCGDGFARAMIEACDDGADNGADKACTPECTVNTCGDGYVGPGESCDSADRAKCTSECLAVLFDDRVENGIAGWTHMVVNISPEPCNTPSFCFDDLWMITADVPKIDSHPDMNGSTRAWWTGDLSRVKGPASTRLMSPLIDLSAVKAPIRLEFVHFYHFLQNMLAPKWAIDGAIIEVSVDGGPFMAIAMPGYTGPISDDGECPLDNPLLGEDAFLDEVTAWSSESTALDAFAGHMIQIGFHIGVDCAVDGPLDPIDGPFKDDSIEWYIDNIRVVGNTAAR